MHLITRTVLALLLFFISAPKPTACTWAPHTVVEFDPNTYVFEGRVVGYTLDSTRNASPSPETVQRFLDERYPDGQTGSQEEYLAYLDSLRYLIPQPPASLLLIEPTDVVYAPRQARTYSLLYGDSPCGPSYLRVEELRARFAIGDTVFVRDAVFDAYAQQRPANTTPLRATLGEYGIVTHSAVRAAGFSVEPWPLPTTPTDPDSPPSTAEPIYQLMRLAKHWESYRHGPEADLTMEQIRAAAERVAYEYTSDLARLHLASDSKKRLELVVKIRSYSAHARYAALATDLGVPAVLPISEFDFYYLASLHLRDDEIGELRLRLIALFLPIVPTREEAQAARPFLGPHPTDLWQRYYPSGLGKESSHDDASD